VSSASGDGWAVGIGNWACSSQRYVKLSLLYLERIAGDGDWTVEIGSSQIRNNQRARREPADRWGEIAIHRGTGGRARTEGNVTMQVEGRSSGMDAIQPRPLAELLECPPATGNLLNVSSQCIDFDAGETVFRQSALCKGLYVVITGQFLRRAERMETRLNLGPVRPGDLVELAAALGVGHQTYTLTAQTRGSVLLLPLDAMNQAFQAYPALRMRLLEELAREVSRAYEACCLSRTARSRRVRDAAPLE
jgi:hypothetical protein